jgi:rubrerythrin
MKPEDFRKIISQAIDGEIEAHSFYCTVAEKMADAALKNTFAKLADEEINHQEFLHHIMFKASRTMYQVVSMHPSESRPGVSAPALVRHALVHPTQEFLAC